MKVKYFNLRMIDWNFDYKRGIRFPIFGDIVELPEEVGDAYPQYFKRVEKKVFKEVEQPEVKEAVVKEVESETVNIKDDEKVVTEPNMDSSLEVLFESDLKEGKVKETKKNYVWNDKKIDKEEYKKAENKSEFLFEILN